MSWPASGHEGVDDFPNADMLVDGSKTVAVGPNSDAGAAEIVNADGKIIMPSFIDITKLSERLGPDEFAASGW